MSANTFGEIFRITTYGESHGISIGVVIDGCPSLLEIDFKMIEKELMRRRPGQSHITTSRNETEEFTVESGIFEGVTTGTPIHIKIRNIDHRPKDYNDNISKYRPSHADYSYEVKYGIKDHAGGGRSSARETVARVVAGAIAKQILQKYGVSIFAFVSQVGNIAMEETQNVDYNLIESNIVRCPESNTANQMIQLIEEVKKQGDTIGGCVTCHILNVPAGIGSPVFDKLHADLGKAMLSINAVKGFEYGSGFRCIQMKGTEHNDQFDLIDNKVTTTTNYSGGIQGGISNGMPINMNVAFKPVATIMMEQDTINQRLEKTTIKNKGRHDPCVVPRAVPIVEAMAAIVMVDHILRAKTTRL